MLTLTLTLTPTNAPYVLHALVKARALIEDPKHWTTKAFARHANGNPIGYNTDNAVCFCSLGAVRRAAFNEGLTLVTDLAEIALIDWVQAHTSIRTVADFNDVTTHADVLRMFDGAIAKVKEMVSDPG